MLTRALILTATLTLTSGFIAYANRAETIPARTTFNTLPLNLGEWQGRILPPFEDKVLALLGLDDYVNRAYLTKTTEAGLYIGYWKSQRQGDAIHSPLNCLPGAGWEPTSKDTITIPVMETPAATTPRPIAINRLVIQKGLDQQIVLYWYQSHGRVMASEYAVKFFLVNDALRLNRTDAGMVRVIVPIGSNGTAEDVQRAEENGTRFIKTLFPLLSAYLPS